MNKRGQLRRRCRPRSCVPQGLGEAVQAGRIQIDARLQPLWPDDARSLAAVQALQPQSMAWCALHLKLSQTGSAAQPRGALEWPCRAPHGNCRLSCCCGRPRHAECTVQSERSCGSSALPAVHSTPLLWAAGGASATCFPSRSFTRWPAHAPRRTPCTSCIGANRHAGSGLSDFSPRRECVHEAGSGCRVGLLGLLN